MTAISLVVFAGGSSQQGQGQASAPGPAQHQQPAESDSQAATQLYQAADTAASSQGPCTSDDHNCIGLEAVAEAVMQQGCCDKEGRAVQLMKPFLPGALLVLTRTEGASRFGNSLSNHNTTVQVVTILAINETKRFPAWARYV